VQWVFVALGVGLIAVAAAEAVALRRMQAQTSTLLAAKLQAETERDDLDRRLARERSAREALALEVSRLRGSTQGGALPTLTLQPLRAPSSAPPEPTVAPPSPLQLIALRLLLPAGADTRRPYALTIRTWSGGEHVWMRGGLTTSAVESQRMVIAHVGGDVLAPGSYEINLDVTAPDGERSHAASYELSVR
jgi:hypothetical protein